MTSTVGKGSTFTVRFNLYEIGDEVLEERDMSADNFMQTDNQTFSPYVGQPEADSDKSADENSSA